jgi:hypothetical protein
MMSTGKLDSWLERNGWILPDEVKAEITELREALRVAQEELALQMQLKGNWFVKANESRKQRDALQAKLSAIEAQEPVAWMYECGTPGGYFVEFSKDRKNGNYIDPKCWEETKLYAAPVAPAQNELMEALETIAYAGMSGSGQESEEALTEWRARRAWQFISIAACALEKFQTAQPTIKDCLTVAQPLTEQAQQPVLNRLMRKDGAAWLPASEWVTGEPDASWAKLVENNPGEWCIKQPITGKQVADAFAAALTRPAEQVRRTEQVQSLEFNGLTKEETDASMSVRGLSKKVPPAQGELLLLTDDQITVIARKHWGYAGMAKEELAFARAIEAEIMKGQ